MSRQPFQLTMPKHVTTPVVVASPHSGRGYDAAFLDTTVLDEERIRSSEDAYVDLLIERVPQLGVPLLTAGMPRAFLDLNRAAEELDPAVVQDVPRGAMNPRISSGLGVIPRVVAQGRAIYRGKITQEEAQHRIETYWRPYHDQLHALLSSAHQQFGQAILLDCHSMPHEAIATTGGKGRHAEVVLGDRFGSSAATDLVDTLEAVFEGLGLRVARNAPFAGAYVTQAYGQPDRGRHAIQIEIDRALYLNEDLIERTTNFDAIRDLMTEAVAQFCLHIGQPRSLAAE
ncbi:N-formylglutamate amidohydrolase [Jannaschia faecimaris]|nr:N-formylglutamate amidohydrolase [Jannaschia faecimaris]